MKEYFADIRVDFRVYFTDNNEDDLNTQAIEAIEQAMHYDNECIEDNGMQIIRVGEVGGDR